MNMTDAFILIALIYVVAGLTVGLLFIVRSRRRVRPQAPQPRKKAPVVNTANTFNLNGRYQLTSPAHKQGGMATIWLAIERKTGNTCAVKTPRRGTNMDNVYLDKVMLEAAFLKKLKHQGIVKYIDDFYSRDEFHLVMEYLNGVTLMESSLRTPYSEDQVIDFACQLLEALSYIHTQGIVHRDVNPKNIMLCNDGTLRLIDFGTAKTLNEPNKKEVDHDPFTQITNKGFDIPELFIGGDTDQRVDLCGLAQTCLYLLTLSHPNNICGELFKSSWPRSYGEAKMVADYLGARNVSSRTAKCLAQAIMFAPGKRFATAKAMMSALSTAEGYPAKAEAAV